MRISLLVLACFVFTGAAAAEVTLSIPLDLGNTGNVSSQTYSCGDREPFSVQYVNAGPNSLAIVPVDGEDRIFVNVLSASGAQYVSGEHVWWTKGDTAMLQNQLQDGSKLECAAE